MTTTTAPAATDDLTDAQYDLTERILDRLCDRGDRKAYSPSEIGRLVKATTDEVRAVLPALVADGNLGTSGNGAWTRYTFLRG